MAKYSGVLGFAMMKETSRSIYEEEIVEVECRGDVLSNFRKIKRADKINDDVEISNKISILGNPFINKNLRFIKYMTFMGDKWKVSDIEVLSPRIILTLGEIYNE